MASQKTTSTRKDQKKPHPNLLKTGDHPEKQHRLDMNFVIEQYTQYHEIRRQLNGFSWQIPSIAAVIIVLLLGLEPEKARQWLIYPIFPAIGLLFISMFVFVILVNHIRNITILRNFEVVLKELEETYGVAKSVYAAQISKNISLKWWQKGKSSVFLGYFLVCLMTTTFTGCLYLFYKAITLPKAISIKKDIPSIQNKQPKYKSSLPKSLSTAHRVKIN